MTPTRTTTTADRITVLRQTLAETPVDRIAAMNPHLGEGGVISIQRDHGHPDPDAMAYAIERMTAKLDAGGDSSGDEGKPDAADLADRPPVRERSDDDRLELALSTLTNGRDRARFETLVVRFREAKRPESCPWCAEVVCDEDCPLAYVLIWPTEILDEAQPHPSVDPGPVTTTIVERLADRPVPDDVDVIEYPVVDADELAERAAALADRVTDETTLDELAAEAADLGLEVDVDLVEREPAEDFDGAEFGEGFPHNNGRSYDATADLLLRAATSIRPATVKLGAKISDDLARLRDALAEEESMAAAVAEIESSIATHEAAINRHRAQLAELTGKPHPDARPIRKRPAVDVTARTIREWAANAGVECPTHGRIPARVREAYEAAQADR